MGSILIQQQCHGYRGGHQLLDGSVKLDRNDQDAIDRLSDISGALRPGEAFEPYLTAYPLPSGSYFVFARTWQDLLAKRAGCVLTRSLLIPTQTWMELVDISSLLDHLVPIDRNNIDARAFEYLEVDRSLAAVPVNQGLEIVESLFLEERKAIAVFSSPSPELITLRLLTALWPGLRKKFSACTFALAPRVVSGRPFDLVFAANDARSRFARWEGRRIDGSGERETTGRHRWSLSTAKRVLEDPRPDLSPVDLLGVLKSDSVGDESRLRLALLWNDLVEQSKSSPIAVLGMLDILQSVRGEFDLANREVIELISSSISAASDLEPKKAFEFLVALTRKIGSKTLPRGLVGPLRNRFRSIIEFAPMDAFSYAKDNESALIQSGSLALRGIAEGFARVGFQQLRLQELNDELILNLLAASPSFAVSALSEPTRDASWIARIPALFRLPEVRLTRKAKRNLLASLCRDDQAPILKLCLNDISLSELERTLHLLARTSQLFRATFEEVFVDAFRARNAIRTLRSFASEVEHRDQVQALLLASFTGEVEDFEWILSESTSLAEQMRISLLENLLSRSHAFQIEAISRHVDLGRKVLSLAPQFVSSRTAVPIAQLLTRVDYDIVYALGFAEELLSRLPKSVASQLLNAVVARGLRSAPRSANGLVQRLMNGSSFEMATDHIVANAITPQSSLERVSDNVILLNDARSEIRRGVLQYVDNLTGRLLQLNPVNFPVEGFRAWASIISDSHRVNPIGQIRAASAVLPFAMSHPDKPVSDLIVSAFPVVYKELREGRESPSLLTLLFTDWDRCKVARKDLVRSFLHSSWPATDLLASAFRADDPEKIMVLVRKNAADDRFLQDLRKAIKNLPERDRQVVEQALSDDTDIKNARS